MTDTLTLHTAGLFSKWGFNDGDCPDQVLDWLEEHEEVLLGGSAWSWHEVLAELAATHLVPWFDGRVDVYEISTAHNPIRARTMDGVDVDDYEDNDDLVDQLAVALVEIHRDVVLATIRRHLEAEEAPC